MHPVLAGRDLHTEPRHTHRQKMQTHPSRGFTPPINFTAGTLNFIGNVKPVVKVHTRTHT